MIPIRPLTSTRRSSISKTHVSRPGNAVSADVEGVRSVERHEQLAADVHEDPFLQLDEPAGVDGPWEKADSRRAWPIRVPVRKFLSR